MSKNELPLAVAYIRMSTDKQDMSPADQRAKLYPWAEGRYGIVEEYLDEGKSGSKDTDKRTNFLRMVRDLTIGKHVGRVKFVIAVDKSRFDRLDTLTGAEHKKALRDAGVKLDTPLNGLIDYSTMMGRLMDAVLSEANHTTPRLIAEKGLQGRIRVTKQGRPNQTTPYGLAKLVTNPMGETTVIPRGQRWATPKTWGSVFCPGDKQEAEAVLFMFRTFDTEDISFNEIARRLHEKGYPVPREAESWQGPTVRAMLQNVVYAGALMIGDNPKGEFFRTSNGKETARDQAGDREPVIAWGSHEPLIPRDLWDRVQAKLKGNRKARRRSPRNRGPYALSGILKCGKCGGLMYGSKNPDGRIIYRCHKTETGPSQCGYWIAYEAQILPIILGDFLSAIRQEVIREAGKGEVVQVSGEAARLKKELKALTAKLENGREAVMEATKATRPGLMATLDKMEQQKAELEARLADEAGKTKESRLLAWWEQYQREFFDSCPIDVGIYPAYPDEPKLPLPDPSQPGIYGDYQPTTGEVVVVKTKVPASVIREKLKRLNCEAFAWFKRKAKGRGYDLDRLRVKAYVNGQLCYEYAANAAS